MAAGIDLRERLIQHYEAHYSANLMRFTVVSNHSIHSMTEMVSGLFSEVPNYNIVPFKCLQGPASGPQLAQHLVFMQSNKEKDALNIRFELTEYDNDHVPFTWWADLDHSQRPFWHCDPLLFLASIIGDESKGSLLAHLKDKGWAQSLMAGPCGDDLTGYSNFDIGITLTPNGKCKFP